MGSNAVRGQRSQPTVVQGKTPSTTQPSYTKRHLNRRASLLGTADALKGTGCQPYSLTQSYFPSKMRQETPHPFHQPATWARRNRSEPSLPGNDALPRRKEAAGEQAGVGLVPWNSPGPWPAPPARPPRQWTRRSSSPCTAFLQPAKPNSCFFYLSWELTAWVKAERNWIKWSTAQKQPPPHVMHSWELSTEQLGGVKSGKWWARGRYHSGQNFGIVRGVEKLQQVPLFGCCFQFRSAKRGVILFNLFLPQFSPQPKISVRRSLRQLRNSFRKLEQSVNQYQ